VAAAMKVGAMTVGELLDTPAGGALSIEINDLVLDSRDVSPGAAFVAVGGARTHGLAYAAAAIERGAAVVLFEPDPSWPAPPEPSVAVADLKHRLGELANRFYGRKAMWPALTGVTGTNGKTTVTYLIAQALTRLQQTCGYIGTLGFGIPPVLTEHRLTTPDCLTLHKEIALMPVRNVVLEVSSHALAQNRLDGLNVSSAVFTNLSRDHLDQHGDFPAYAKAKSSLFTRPELDQVVLNLDDPYAATLEDQIADSVRVLGVSIGRAENADLAASIEKSGMDGLELSISGAYGAATLRSSLVGEFNAGNLMLALGALLNLDVSLSDACVALGECAAPPGRMETFEAPAGGPLVVVDYAHTPDALERALASLSAQAEGEIWCVFGCGGDRDRGKRRMMGEIAARGAEHIVLTDDNPRTEDPAAIVREIAEGTASHPSVRIVHDREKAIEIAVTSAATGDIVLVAGKGHEHRQLTAAGQRELDDRKIVAAILEGLA